MLVNLEYTSLGMLCCHELRIIWQVSGRLKSCGNMSGLAPVGVSVPVATRTLWLRRDVFFFSFGVHICAFSYLLLSPGEGLWQNLKCDVSACTNTYLSERGGWPKSLYEHVQAQQCEVWMSVCGGESWAACGCAWGAGHWEDLRCLPNRQLLHTKHKGCSKEYGYS